MAFLTSCDTNEKFHLSKGETTIGRGPFLKVGIYKYKKKKHSFQIASCFKFLIVIK